METSLITKETEHLFKKYDTPGSYYATYPPVGLWNRDNRDSNFKAALAKLIETPNKPLQLYIHFPFCEKQCWYCLCYQKVTKNKETVGKFVEYLLKEIDLFYAMYAEAGVKPNFVELHFGGGTPTYVSDDDFDSIIDSLSRFVDFDNLKEFSIEVDPRTVSRERLLHLSKRKVSRLSLGIQDFDERVQKSINRLQSKKMVEELLDVRNHFSGINFDLIFGLPMQSRESLRTTIKTVLSMAPDRITHSVMGHRPDIIPHHKLIKNKDIPDLITKARMWEDSSRMILDAGYEPIGLGHFSAPGDSLIKAKSNKSLLRYANGYSPGHFEEYVSFGVSAMSRISETFFQSTFDFDHYYNCLDNKTFPIFKSQALKHDDLLRCEVMHQLINYSQLSFSDISSKFGIDFNDYFSDEIKKFETFRDEGILIINDDGLEISDLGYYFLRNVCEIFDNLNKPYKLNLDDADEH